MHKQMKSEADKNGILVNDADTPGLCDVFPGSIAEKGNRKIAISTNGKIPAGAKTIGELPEDSTPDEIDESLNNLHLIRNKISGDFAEKVKQLNELTKTMAEEN
jgi:siroheme synthase (precorrin-2 oxidase/ferrochelatase)